MQTVAKPGDPIGHARREVGAFARIPLQITFLKERKAQKPFSVYLTPPVPHDPRVAAPEFMSRYAEENVPLPAARRRWRSP